MDISGRDRYERFLEDYEVGEVHNHWPGRTITEAANENFCLLTSNSQPLHLDAEYASGTQHGQRLVNGMFVLSTAVGMSITGLSGNTIAQLDFEQVLHERPTYIGDSIYAESKVLEVRRSRSRPDRGMVQVETIVTNQRGERVLTFKRRFMVPGRSQR
ncbi:MaoC family dehydratase [Dehalococcoidia bacterium]|nr:MaoC family dehydratase [Dehalococcoidia bacterium]